MISDRWPSHNEMIEKLKNIKKIRVGVQELRVLFPDIWVCDLKVTLHILKDIGQHRWNDIGLVACPQPNSLSTLLGHYRSAIQDSMELPRLHNLQRDNEVMMQKLAVMMGVPLPTVVDTITRERYVVR